jgi:type II secretory pathway predicted ATPase ExeA/septal ring-binding cell division protein DamX
MNSNEISESSNGESSPFRESFKAEIFFSGVGRLTLLTSMRRDIADCISVVVLTGAPGVGKSMVGRVLADGGFTGCQVIYLPETVESFEDVVRVIAEKVDVVVEDYSRAGISSAMGKIAAGIQKYGQRLVVICDGAEKIYLATLERIRKMLDRVNGTGVFMQVVFVGNTEFLDNLKQLSICNFTEVPEKRYNLKPLTLSETTTYIDSCLKSLPDEEREVFTPEVVDRIFQNSEGNFRRINALAEEVRKRHSHDASFWVLLENVEGSTSASGKMRWSKWIKALYPVNIRKPKVLIIGSVMAVGLIILIFATGRDEEGSSLEVNQDLRPQASLESVVNSSGAVGVDEKIVAENDLVHAEDATPENLKEVTAEQTNAEVIPVPDGPTPTTTEISDIESAATSAELEELGREHLSTEVVQDISNQAREVIEDISEEGDTVQSTVRTAAESAVKVITPQKEHLEEKIQTIVQANSEVLQEKKLENMPPELTGIPDEKIEKTSSPEKIVNEVVRDIVKAIEPEPLTIPVLSPTQTKKIILVPTEKKAIDEKEETSNIVISSLTRTDERDVPVISGGQEKKRIAVNTADLAVTESNMTMQKAEKSATSPATSKVSDLPGQTDRVSAETDIKKIPVVGAAIIPEISTVAQGGMYGKRVAAGSSWLAGKKDNKYTIQLMVLSSESAEASMGKILGQKQYSKEAGQFYIFEKATNPQAVFVFLGEYNSMTEAREARDRIPEAFQKHKPYVLSVQGAMQKVK